MDVIKLIKKDQEDGRSLLVYDELITGLLTGNFFVPVVTGADKGYRIFPLDELVDKFMFPVICGRPETRITDFLRGYPKMYEKLSFYESTLVEL